jgi:hypothetical protein
MQLLQGSHLFCILSVVVLIKTGKTLFQNDDTLFLSPKFNFILYPRQNFMTFLSNHSENVTVLFELPLPSISLEIPCKYHG